MRIVGNDPELSRQLMATASGAISAAGKPLVVNTDGTVKEISVVEQSASVGSAVVFESAAMGSAEGSISFDTANNRIIIAYPDDGNSSYGTVVVGTVSGTSISFGTPEVFVSVGTSQMSSAFDTNAGKVAIVYRQGSTSRAIVGTTDSSDNSMDFGDSMEWNSTYSNYQYATFDSTNNKILVVFSDYTSGTNGMAIVGTISGTDITFGSKATFYSGALFNQMVQFDPSQNKSLITYRKSSDNKPYVRVGDSSSGSFSFGTEVNVNTGTTGGFCSVYHADEQKMVIFYSSASDLDAKVATISGTDVTLGTAVSIDTGNVGDSRAVYDPDAQKIAVVFRDDSATSLELKLCTLSGSTLALSGYTDSGEGTVLDSDDAYYFDVAYDTNANSCVAYYYDNGNSGYGTAVAFQNAFTKETLTTENFIGTSAHSAADGAKVLVNTQGAVDDNQSGLTAGQTYYVDKNGALQLTTNVAQSLGSETEFTTTAANYVHVVYDSNSNRSVLIYRNGTNSKGEARVGTVSGTSISYGTAVEFEQGNTEFIGATFDSNSNKVVIAYRDAGNSNYGTAIVGTVDPSDNSISFGTAAVFESAHAWIIDATFDSSNNKVVIVYTDADNSNYGTAIVGTVSGTDITFGTAVVFKSAATYYAVATFDTTNNKVVVCYDSSNGYGIVGTVSGTSISFGSETSFDSGGHTDLDVAYDSTSGKVLVVGASGSDSSRGEAVVGTVSGTSISFGTLVSYEAGASTYNRVVFDTNVNKAVVTFRDQGDSNKGKFILGTISGTDVSFSGLTVFNDANTTYNGTDFDSTSNRVVIGYKDDGDGDDGTVRVLQNGNDLSGSLSHNVVTAGTALSATKLLVKG